MNFVLVGDGQPAAGTLRHLLGSGVSVRAVYSTPGQQNRGALTRLCEGEDIPLLDSDVLAGSAGAESVGEGVDWLLNVNSTVLLPDSVIQMPSAGALNMHPGVLPEYAGLHTHQWAIRNGEKEFGVTIHEMVPSVDAGDVVRRRSFDLDEGETGLSLFLKCMEHGLALFCEVIDDLTAGTPLVRTPQDLSRRRLYRHRDALDGALRWALSAVELERFVRAGSYAPLQSPSYTPTLTTQDGVAASVLSAHALEVSAEGAPGFVLPAVGDQGPKVVCAGGGCLILDALQLDGESYEGAEIDEVVPAGQLLQ